jgi:RIO kinase 1
VAFSFSAFVTATGATHPWPFSFLSAGAQIDRKETDDDQKICQPTNSKLPEEIMSTDYVQEYVDSSLDPLIAEGLISETLYPVKSGKEATVYCCLGGPAAGVELLAAKVYKPLEARVFRNDAAYKQGRTRSLGRRDKLAYAKKTAHGRDLQFGIWIGSEYQTLGMLHAVGADVPRPIARSGGALLIEYFGDRDGAAPMLSQVTLPPPQALAAFKRIIRNVALWLRHDLVHGDLSPYNILYWNERPTIIDFPQAVDPRFNQDARALLERDVENVCRHFARQGVEAEAVAIADELWRRYRRAEL